MQLTHRPGRRSADSATSVAERRWPAPAGEALRIEGVSKAYGRVQALTRVGMTVSHGEVVALVGDNGAGKSTLVKIVSGVVSPDEGAIFVHGEPVTVRTPNQAAAVGIATVHQDRSLADNLDVVENLYLGRELVRRFGPFRWIDSEAMQRHTRQALADLGLGTIGDIGTPVGFLSGGQRQTVVVARATSDGAAIILLDEPTTGLGVDESRRVMERVTRLRDEGAAIVVVSQNIDEVFEVADRIVVLHLGEVAATHTKSETTPEAVVSAIMGMAF